jgi:hypothetical protein
MANLRLQEGKEMPTNFHTGIFVSLKVFKPNLPSDRMQRTRFRTGQHCVVVYIHIIG